MVWTEKDKKRVRAVLDTITARSSQAEVARAAGLKSRSVLNNWRRRGIVPVEHIQVMIALAAQVGQTVTPGDLNPDARLIELAAKAIPPTTTVITR